MTLDDLIKAVEAGDDDAVKSIIYGMASAARDKGDHFNSVDTLKAYYGSLDSANAVHDALLPGWFAMLRHSTRPLATVGYVDRVFEGQDDVLSRAWLLAILKAKQAEGRG